MDSTRPGASLNSTPASSPNWNPARIAPCLYNDSALQQPAVMPLTDECDWKRWNYLFTREFSSRFIIAGNFFMKASYLFRFSARWSNAGTLPAVPRTRGQTAPSRAAVHPWA